MRSSSSTMRIRGLDTRRLPLQRQPHGDHGAAARAVVRDRVPVMLLEDALDDRQAQAGAAATPREERLEYARQILRAESGTLVGYGDLHHFPRVAISISRDRDDRAAGRVLDRVVDQI